MPLIYIEIPMRRAALVVLAVLCMFVSPRTVAAQDVTRTFQELQQRVRRGDRVYVTDDTGRTVKGKLTAISDGRLRTLVGGTPSEWLEGTVLDVHLERPASPGKRWLIGLGVGFATDVAVARLVAHCSVGADCEARGERAILIGPAVGATTGWLVGRRLKQRVLVYVSAQEKTETPVSFDSRSPASQATVDPRARTAPSGEPSVYYGKADGAEQIRCSDVQNATLLGRGRATGNFAAGDGMRESSMAALSPGVALSRDSILMGGLIGFGTGAVLGTTVGAEACLHDPRWHSAVKVGVPLAAIGALIGWLHK
jgi:hypothetical protein